MVTLWLVDSSPCLFPFALLCLLQITLNCFTALVRGSLLLVSKIVFTTRRKTYEIVIGSELSLWEQPVQFMSSGSQGKASD